jgi:nicotinamidase-related amidase
MPHTQCIDPYQVSFLGIDFQTRLMPAIQSNQSICHQASVLIEAARLLSIPTIVTAHCPEKLGPISDQIQAPQAQVIEKQSFDATASASIATLSPANQIVVFGCETHVCVLQTVAGLVSAGNRQVFVVADACGTRAPDNHAYALQRMRDWGVSIVTTEMVLFETVQRPAHAEFRSILSLITR